jgi:hypothetical protein
MVVLIEEEYGFRHWALEYEGDPESLIVWWKNLPSVMGMFFNPSNHFPGLMFEIFCLEEKEGLGYEKQGKTIEISKDKVSGVFFHVHMENDSYLKYKGIRHYHAGHETF